MTPTFREQDVIRALADKSAAYFGSWCTNGEYLVPKHIDVLSDIITEAVDKGGARIIVVAPPRHGKSEFVCVQVPARFIWKNPKRRVILVGHNETFATTWGRKVRDLICENYPRLNVKIRGMMEAAMNEWYTDKGGGMRCAGVGVGIVGLGADLFIIDDPTPDSKAARSPNHQLELREWYTGVVDRRLEPGASVIVSMQRWPDEDFVSWLQSMSNLGKGRWKIIRLPAIYDAEETVYGKDLLNRDPNGNGGLGEPLWPERWPIEEMITKRQETDDMSFWYSQYQQRPPAKSNELKAYSNFHPEESTSTMEFNPYLPVLWALDFNVDPMCSVIGQLEERTDISPLDIVLGTQRSKKRRTKMHILDELYLRNNGQPATQRACDEFCKWVDRYRLPDQPITIKVYGDASGLSRKTTSSPDYHIIKERLTRHFSGSAVIKLDIQKNNPLQRERVAVVNNALMDANGDRNLLISTKCVNLRTDFVKGNWERDSDGNPTGNLDDSDSMRMHISDACGYLSWRVQGIGKKHTQKQKRLL